MLFEVVSLRLERMELVEEEKEKMKMKNVEELLGSIRYILM